MSLSLSPLCQLNFHDIPICSNSSLGILLSIDVICPFALMATQSPLSTRRALLRLSLSIHYFLIIFLWQFAIRILWHDNLRYSVPHFSFVSSRTSSSTRAERKSHQIRVPVTGVLPTPAFILFPCFDISVICHHHQE